MTNTFKENIISENSKQLKDLCNITWSQWGKVPYVTNDGEEKTKLGFVENKGSAAKLLMTYFTQLNNISQHQFIKVWQKQNFNLALHHLQHSQVLFVQDFQMNMLLYVQVERSTIHWDHAQMTVHPTSLFYVCPNPICNKIVCENLIHISLYKDHDKYAVKKFFETCVTHLTKKNIAIQEFIIFTDNCVGQYKSRFVFYWMSKLKQPSMHHFYAPKHGKGPSDRARGTFKRKMRNYVKAKGILLSTEDIENYYRRNYDH